jgi:hypothetical protein
MHTAVNGTFYSPSKSSQNCSCLTHTALLRALKCVRGDDKTFAGESAKLAIPGTGANLIATADREGTN